MNAADAITSPLPAFARSPLLMVIDIREDRLDWVLRVLAFANYHAYAAATPLEAFSWYMQYLVVPEAILLGQIRQQELFFVYRLLQRMVLQPGNEVPVLYLSTYIPDTAFMSIHPFSSNSPGCYPLLEALWQIVPRRSIKI